MMFSTIIRALDVKDGVLRIWDGPRVVAPSREEAELYCQMFMGHCEVDGILTGEGFFDDKGNPVGLNPIWN